MPRKERVIESYIHEETLKDLVISHHLYTLGRVKDTEEVIKLEISLPNAEGVRTLRYMFIEEHEAQIILHN